MISPTGRQVDIPIENGYVGMVDREHFDAFLRQRAQDAGAHRYAGTFTKITRDADGTHVVYRDKISGNDMRLTTKLVIGADGARSNVARAEIKDGDKIPYVIAYHEIIEAPAANATYDPLRCDVVYDGRISPDFYGWVFPHGAQASVGMGSMLKSVDVKQATADLRAASGLTDCKTIRREGAPIPLKPLDCWDNGRDVVLAGDAAGVVAPSSGEGIYYAMVAGVLRQQRRRPVLPPAGSRICNWRANCSCGNTSRCSAFWGRCRTPITAAMNGANGSCPCVMMSTCKS
jgi:geranylgeranyl reductase family